VLIPFCYEVASDTTQQMLKFK